MVYEKIFQKMKKDPSVADDMIKLCASELQNGENIEEALHYGRRTAKFFENTILCAENKDVLRLFKLHKRILRVLAPFDFESYLLYVEWEREPEKKFYIPRRKQLKPVVEAMQGLIDDKLDLLCISMPPGTGKSTLGIFFLSWVMGKYPDAPNLASAHSGSLTRSFYDGVHSIITDPDYLWSDVFPGTTDIIPNAKDESIDLNKKHRFSTLTCRAINASLTGATRCEKILYADDLCSGIEEALSKERMDKLWTLYNNDLKSRKKLNAKEIHIATRWSVHDVIGRLELEYGKNERCKFITLPALNEEGKSNFEYPYGVGFSTEYFEDMKSNLDDASFRALYMNEPIEREGLLYDSEELNYYYELPTSPPDAIVAVCDTKDKGTDYAVLPVAYLYGESVYIEDVVCNNGLPDVVDELLANMLYKHKVQSCQFESNAAGGRTAQKVNELVHGKGGITSITSKFTTANKETKIIVNSAYVKEHFYFKAENRSREYTDMLRFLTGYTVMGKNKHDDVPDAMAMLAMYIQTLGVNSVEVFKRPW